MKVPAKLLQQARWVAIQKRCSAKRPYDHFLDGAKWMFKQMHGLLIDEGQESEFSLAINNAVKDMNLPGTGFFKITADGIMHIKYGEHIDNGREIKNGVV